MRTKSPPTNEVGYILVDKTSYLKTVRVSSWDTSRDHCVCVCLCVCVCVCVCESRLCLTCFPITSQSVNSSLTAGSPTGQLTCILVALNTKSCSAVVAQEKLAFHVLMPYDSINTRGMWSFHGCSRVKWEEGAAACWGPDPRGNNSQSPEPAVHTVPGPGDAERKRQSRLVSSHVLTTAPSGSLSFFFGRPNACSFFYPHHTVQPRVSTWDRRVRPNVNKPVQTFCWPNSVHIQTDLFRVRFA